MTGVLGWPLIQAAEQLTREGVTVEIAEASSRKGTGGSDRRVIRQQTLPSGAVKLTAAAFITTIEQ